MDWPNIRKPGFPLKVEYENTSLKSAFEDGSVQSRNKFTRSRRTFTLQWTYMSDADHTTLFNFITGTCHFSAASFNWTYPGTNTVIEVRAVDGFDTWQWNKGKYWTGSIVLQEV